MQNPKDPILPNTIDPVVPNATDPDVIPQPEDDRAQPGDVLGVERDGERTYLGETHEDEDRRREDAERTTREERSTQGAR